MTRFLNRGTFAGLAALVISLIVAGCSTQATTKYWGKVNVPQDNVLRYITGSEPESLDPQFVTGQPEARILIGLYTRLVEYEPKTMAPIPEMATHWEQNENGTVYTFYLRKNGKFSNGEPIKAEDFAWSFRRALSPELASRYAFLGYDMKYAEAFNSGQAFVKVDGKFIPENHEDANEASDTNCGISEPMCLTVPSDPFALAQTIEGDDLLRGYFSFRTSDLKDPAQFVKAVNSQDAFASFVRSKLDSAALSACATAAGCDAQSRETLVAGLNKLITDETVYSPDRFGSLTLGKDSTALIKAFNEANEKIADSNAEIDAQVAELKDPKEKEEKAKSKKEPIGKLFFMNRFLVGDYFKGGLEEVPIVMVKPENVGVEATDDYTLKITLKQSAPYFVGLLTHQFFSALYRPVIDKWGKDWIKPEHIVTSGPFKLGEWKPYDEMTIVRDPNYWDAANVHLDGIKFYPMDEQTTMMNLYKAGRVDALYNHTVPAAWNEFIRQFKDEYLLHPEMSIEYYTFSVKKPPVDKVEVRKAFALSIDRVALEKYRKTVKRLVNFTPEGIFPEYEKARKEVYAELTKKEGIPEQQWKDRMFDPQRACDLMKEAGYTVQPTSGGKCKVTDFPASDMTLSYNTAESNKQVAEFVQAQWKQNLGIEIQLKNMEWKTYLPYRSKIEYTGAARAGWVGDYVDPFTFLSQFYTQKNDSSTGWWNPEYDKLLEKANNTADPTERFRILAEAEFMMLQDQPVIPLATSGTSWMKKPYVKGMYPNPGTMHPWKFVYIEQDRNNWDRNVDEIMTGYTDPKVQSQVAALMKSQLDFEASKKKDSEEKKDNKSE